MNTEVDILIIGAGLSGTALAANILRESQTLRLAIIDRSPGTDFGPAYRTNCPSHLLNTRPGAMSALAGDPAHFVRFAEARGEAVSPEFFAKRSLYRDYLQSIADESLATGRLHHFQGSVVSLRPTHRGWFAELQDGRNLSATSVVLTFGAFSPDPIRAAKSVIDHPAYINDLWADRSIRFPEGARRLGVIGSGLTAIDAVLSAEIQGLGVHATLISRRGLIPQRHGPPIPAQTPPPPLKSLRELVRSVRTAAEGAQDWRAVVDGMRPNNADYWRALPVRDQARFLRHVRMFWEIHRHRMAPEIADAVDSLRKAGRLAVRKADITQIEEDGPRLRVIYSNHDSDVFDAVVNCTGLPSAPHWPSPLVAQLVADGYARYDSHRLGLECDSTGRVVGDRDEEDLYAVGFLRRGQLYESTAARELAIQADEVAKALTAKAASAVGD